MSRLARTLREAHARAIFSGLVFTMAWEDPDVDQDALEVTGADNVICVTSAGCNALNLLCQEPRSIVCVDTNPVQNHLLELKCAGIASLDYETFVDIFSGRQPGVTREAYRGCMRALLGEAARHYWDHHIGMVENDIHRYGHMGVFMRIVRSGLRMASLGPGAWEPFFDLTSLEDQRVWYSERLAPRLWARGFRHGSLSRWLLYLAGVHPEQLRRLEEEGPVEAVVRARVEHVLTQIPIANNYFWHMALTGRFREPHLPPFLRREHFGALRRGLERLKIRTGTVDAVLDACAPQSIDKFNLLDILDWMDAEATAETLARVIRSASPQARVLFRSAARSPIRPEFLQGPWHVDPSFNADLVRRERSGTHGSVSVWTRAS